MASTSVVAPIPVSQWIEREVLLPQLSGPINQIPTLGMIPIKELPLPIFLPDRRIYLYLEAQVSGAGAFSLFVDLVLTNKGVPVGAFPCKLADFTSLTPNQSVSRLFNSGGSPVGDSAV